MKLFNKNKRLATITVALGILLQASTALAGNICVGDRVIDSGGHLGTVLEVFSNGLAIVYLDDLGTYNRSALSLGKGVLCNNHVCVNDRVIDSGGHLGTVLEVFDNGNSSVYLDGLGPYIRSISSLSIQLNCSPRENCVRRN
jgi:preprotein translocase subunit YajC